MRSRLLPDPQGGASSARRSAAEASLLLSRQTGSGTTAPSVRGAEVKAEKVLALGDLARERAGDLLRGPVGNMARERVIALFENAISPSARKRREELSPAAWASVAFHVVPQRA